MPPHGCCCLADLGSLLWGQVVQGGLDPVDEPADAGDLLRCGHGVGACPLVQAGRGGQPFPGAEQVIKVGGQVRQVGGVGPEVVAAGAAKPVGAGVAAGLDVGRLGAAAERHGDLADGAAGMLGVQ